MSVVSIVPRLSNFPPKPQPQQQQQSGRVGEVGFGSMSQPTTDEQQLHATLSRMALYVRKTRLQISPFFADFDKHKQGAISWPQFSRVLAIAGFTSLTHDVVENLSRHYSLTNDPTKVSYKSFVNDLDEIVQAQQIASNYEVQRAQSGPTMEFEASQRANPLVRREEEKASQAFNSTRQPFQTQHDIHAESPLTAAKILHKIQTVCQQKRIILNDVFSDFDGLRKNLITLHRFRRCLDVAGFQLSDDEANVLVCQYLNQRDPSQVEYKIFISDVLKPFIPENPETSPLSKLDTFQPYCLEEEETPLARFNQEELDRIEFLLKELGYQTHTRRILIKPGFQHHDHTRNGCVTARQFASVVTATFPFRFHSRDLDLLCAKYRRGSLGIYYVGFIKDVEAQELGAGEYAKTLHPSHAASHIAATMGPTQMQPLQRAGTQMIAGMQIIPTRAAFEEKQANELKNANLQEILHRIGETLNRNRMTIDDVFSDFDSLRKGRVTQTQFSRCLNSQGLRLSPADIYLLTQSYPHSEFKEEVDFRRFVADLSTTPRF